MLQSENPVLRSSEGTRDVRPRRARCPGRGGTVAQPTTDPGWRCHAALALLIFVVALVAALFGFSGIAAAAAGIAKVLFSIFLILFVVSLLAGIMRRG